MDSPAGTMVSFTGTIMVQVQDLSFITVRSHYSTYGRENCRVQYDAYVYAVSDSTLRSSQSLQLHVREIY